MSMGTGEKMKLGRWGETLATEYLAAQGVTIIARNVRTHYGELDIVGTMDDMTVIFEVKTRKTATYGYPEDAITQVKRRHLIESSQSFLQDHPELPGEWRIDVIAIRSISGSQPEIKWFTNAIS
jgi:putative endonuclease